MLQYLVQRAGRLVTHAELLEALWPDSFVQPEVFEDPYVRYSSRARDDAKAPKFIETQPRRGYRFIAGVENGAPAKRPAASIAVLPFAYLGSDRENEYFGDGLAEDVINELTKIPGLTVIARTSAFAFKRQNVDIRRIAELLGVANVLEGSVRKAGNRVRVTAQLIRSSDGSHLWSGRFDRELVDILAVQDEIAQSIADALQRNCEDPANAASHSGSLSGVYRRPLLCTARDAARHRASARMLSARHPAGS